MIDFKGKEIISVSSVDLTEKGISTINSHTSNANGKTALSLTESQPLPSETDQSNEVFVYVNNKKYF